MKYYKARLILDPNREAWLAYSNLAKKMEDIPEVETALINAISLDPQNCDINLQLIFCGLLYLKKGLNETNCTFNTFLSFLYKEKSILSSGNSQSLSLKNLKNINDSLSKKYFEIAKLLKMRSLPPDELKPPEEEKVEEEEDPKKKKGKDKDKDKKTETLTEENKEELRKKGNPRLHPEFKRPILNNEQLDSIWFEAVNLFNKYNFFEISQKLLENATEETKQTIQFKNEQARVLLFRKDYDRVIELCNDIIKQNRLSYNSYIIKGHALYNLNRYEDAEKTYIKAIRFKPQEIQFDIEMLVKLGLIYIKQERWYDAKVIFNQIIKTNPETSFAWRYLGYALTQLGDSVEAEKALIKANILDVENPLIWAYLAIFNLNNGKKYQALECFNELCKVNYGDVNLMKEIAELFYGIEEYEITINIYKKIKEQEKTDGDCYLKIAKIYDEKLDQKDEALKILKEGLDKVLEDNAHHEIELLVQKIEKEQLDLFLGQSDNKENESDNVVIVDDQEVNVKQNDSNNLKEEIVNNEDKENNINSENKEQNEKIVN